MSDNRSDIRASDDRVADRGAARADDAGAAAPRRDPFSYGSNLPMRPNYLPEEEESAGKRSELWNMLKAVVVGTVVVIALGFLLRR